VYFTIHASISNSDDRLLSALDRGMGSRSGGPLQWGTSNRFSQDSTDCWWRKTLQVTTLTCPLATFLKKHFDGSWRF
jgi:hypothetical protein